MTEPLTPTPTPWFCENDGIYNAARSYLITPTGDSDQDRADAAHIVAAVNELHDLRAARIRAEERADKWERYAGAAHVRRLRAEDRETHERGEHNAWKQTAEVASERALRAEEERDRLKDRLDELLPPLTPDREAIMARLDEKMTKLTEDDQGRAKPFLDRREAVEVIQIARHMLRYANDAESGNIALRDRLARAEEERDELRHHLTSEVAALKPTLDRLARAEEALVIARGIANMHHYPAEVVELSNGWDHPIIRCGCGAYECAHLAALSTSEPE